MPETYTIDVNFGSIVPNLIQLAELINSSNITQTLDYPRIDGNIVKLYFPTNLNGNDKSILDSIVASYVPYVLPTISVVTDGSYNTTMTVKGSQTSSRTITLPDATTTLIGDDNISTLTNKTITSTSNNVIAKGLHSSSTVVSVSGASAPTTGQVLTATSGNTATWQAPGGGDVSASSNITNTAVVVGNGGAKGVKSSNWSIDANDKLTISTSQSGYLLDIHNTNGTGGGNGFIVKAGETLGDIAFAVWDQDLTFPIMEQEADRGHITFGKTYAQTLSDNGIVYGIDNQHNTAATDFNTQEGIYRIGGIDVADVPQTLTNKIMTSTSNNVVAKGLHTTSTIVSISGASAPTFGQVLTATSGNSATWQTYNGGIRNYGASAINPTNPTPNAGDEYYNTILDEKMIYDGSRSKWLSINGYMDGCGINGSVSANTYYRRWNGMTLSSSLGPMIPKGTIVKIGYTTSNAVSHTLEVLVNGVVVAELASGGSASAISTTINGDYDEGNISLRNKSGSATASHLQASVYYKLRV